MSNRAVFTLALSFAIATTAFPVAAQMADSPQPGLTMPGSTTPRGGGETFGSISGSVQTIDGRPIRDARVQLKDINTGATLLSVFSKVNGSFELYNIAPGSYELVATSGLSESHERVRVTSGMDFVNLQISAPVSDPSAGNAVSVASLKVPKKAQKEFEKAQNAFFENKLESAKEHVSKALEAYQYYAQALTLRGILLLNDGKAEEGQADLQSALKYDPSYPLAYFAMGAALNQSGQYDDALRTLQRGLALAPDSWQAHFEIAKASLGKSDFEGALKSINRAAQLMKEDYPPLRLVKAHALLGLKQYPSAIAELEGYLFREPNGAAADGARKTLDRAKAFVAPGATPEKSAAAAGGR